MSIRRTGLLFLVIAAVLTPGAASATGHNSDLSGGYTDASGSRFKGFFETFTKTFSVGKHEHRLDLLGDLTICTGSEKGVDQTLIGGMGGVGWTFKPGKTRILLSPHVLVGYFRTIGKDGTGSVAVGGAADFPLDSHSPGVPGWAWRVGFDYVTRVGTTPNLKRVSLGVVYRFGHQP